MCYVFRKRRKLVEDQWFISLWLECQSDLGVTARVKSFPLKNRCDSSHAHADFSRLRRSSGSRNPNSCAEGACKVVATQEEGAVIEKRSSSVGISESICPVTGLMCVYAYVRNTY